jgi:hypothetical protein
MSRIVRRSAFQRRRCFQMERRVKLGAVDDADVPPHDVLRPGTGGRRGRAQDAQGLFGLRALWPMPPLFPSALGHRSRPGRRSSRGRSSRPQERLTVIIYNRMVV